MGSQVEMRLSFWPSGIIGGKAKVNEAIVDAEELAKLCADPKCHCPMGCFSCPFPKKECKDVVEADWLAVFEGNPEKSTLSATNEEKKEPK